MFEQGSVNLGKPLEDGHIRGELLAHLHECTDDIDTHRDGAVALENIGSLQCAVLGEGEGEKPRVTVALGTGHNL